MDPDLIAAVAHCSYWLHARFPFFTTSFFLSQVTLAPAHAEYRSTNILAYQKKY